MKKQIASIRIKVMLFAVALLVVMPACDLTEPTYSVFTPDTYYNSENSVLTSLSGIYRNFANTRGTSMMGALTVTDEVTLWSKVQGWWTQPAYQASQHHNWTAQTGPLGGWNTYFNIVGQVNGLIPLLESSEMTEETLRPLISEARALRAYAYFNLMDQFGNVPIFTEPKVDPNNLPTQNTRSEVFDFVVQELVETAVDIPSQTEVGFEYYGRITKEGIYSILATVYLNAEVYTGTAQYDKALEYANKVIDSGAYQLLPNYFDNFSPDNEANAEMIFGGVFSVNVSGGIGHAYVLKVLPGINGGLFGLPYTPQNGFGTRKSVMDRFEDQDVRKDMFFGYGPLVDPRNGDTVMVERIVPDGNSDLYRPGISTEGPVPYEIIPGTGTTNQPMNAGVKWIKWTLDPNSEGGGDAGNDVAYFRYADILLIKAEALFRLGSNISEALSLVNQIRERSNATPLATLTLEEIYEERGRELVFEGSRRTDMIRFGKFTEAWEFKVADDGEFRNLYPIPQSAIDANPNLKQNPGYN